VKKKPEEHLPKVPPKRTGQRMKPPEMPPEPPVPTSEEVREFLAGAKATEPERAEKRKKKEPEKLPEPPSVKKSDRLPGMEDPAIEELEDTARTYANTRDARMRLLDKECDLKEKLLALMKKNGKVTYHHAGVEVKIVHEKEMVKVKVSKEEE
jgi:hypothetical protein